MIAGCLTPFVSSNIFIDSVLPFKIMASEVVPLGFSEDFCYECDIYAHDIWKHEIWKTTCNNCDLTGISPDLILYLKVLDFF